MLRHFWRSRSLAAVFANNLVDLDDDVFGNLGVNGLAINHLGEGDAYGKLQRLLSEHLFVSIREADKMIEWGKTRQIPL